MNNKKLLTLLVGAGVTLGSEAVQANSLDDIEIDLKNKNLSLDIFDISNLSTNTQNSINASCGNSSCGSNGACR